MTILYKIFGVPQNLEDFVHKAKRKKILAVCVDEEFEIENEEIDFPSGRFLAADYVHYVTVKAENIKKFRCDDYRASIGSSLSKDSPNIVEMVENERRRNCLEVAERLQSLGLNAMLSSYALWKDIDSGNFKPLYSIEQLKEWMKSRVR